MRLSAYRAVAVVALITGVGLLITPFALQLWDRTPAAERTFDRFDALMTEDGLRQARTIYDTTSAGGGELVNEAAPAFARQLGMTPGQFERFTEHHFPAVATGIAEIPSIAAFVAPIVDGLEQGADEFDSAQSIPGLGLPLTATPWLAIGVGLLLLGAGTAALLAPGRVTMLVILAIGGAMVVAPLALGLPEKTANAREIGDVAKLGLGADVAERPRQGVQQLVEMTEQTRDQLVAFLARRLDVSVADLQATLARDFPALAKYLGDYDTMLAQATVILRNQEAAVPDFAKADAIPVKTLPWILVVPGLLLVVAAGTTIAIGRERRAAVPAPATPAAREPVGVA